MAIHLGSGVYYSMRGPAALLWQALGQPADASSLASLLLAHFDVVPEAAHTDAAKFLEQLQAETLVIAATGEAPTPTVPPGVTRAAYVAPHFERFADLQDLLLLDPIHDVGAQGWPHRPPSDTP